MAWRNRPFLTGTLLLGGLVALCLAAVAVVARGGPGLGGRAGKVAVVELTGVILEPSKVVREIRRHGANPAVKAVVLRIDSPGGGVGASQEIYEELKRIRKEGKKVVASMGAVAASGGLYVALAADKIVANEGSITGSIGVIIQFLNLEGLGEKVGVKAVVVKSGQFKDIGSPARPMSEDDRRIIQGVIDDVYDQFVQTIIADRGLSPAEVRRFADGRVFSGRQAKELGLVDDLGNLWHAIHVAATEARIPGEPSVIFPEEPRVSILDLLRGRAFDGLAGGLARGLAPEGLLGPTMRFEYLLTP
jgi:protease-4